MSPSSNSPVISDIQQSLGLKGNDTLFSQIRESASDLLEAAGILLSSATSQTVRTKKRQLAIDLEQLYPDVFGVSPGATRTFEQQRTTSYAILTSAMDLAKRGQKKRKPDEPPGIIYSAKKMYQKSKTPINMNVKPTLQSTPSPSPPKPQSSTECIPPSKRLVSWNIPSPSTPKNPPPAERTHASTEPVDVRVVIIKFDLDCMGPLEQCRVQFCDLVEQSDPGQPSMQKLHDCLREDGLLWEPESYTIVDMDGKAVRNNRGLRCALNSQAAKGFREAEWSIRPLGLGGQNSVKVELLNSPESIIAFTSAP